MPGTVRLNPTDEMLHAAADRLGSIRIVQVLWSFDRPVPRHTLEAEWQRLDQGRLSRRAAPSRVPGARRTWVRAHNTEGLDTTARPVTADTLMEWADREVRVPLPPGSNALWRLAAAPYGSGSVVSLTVPHFRCDGLGIFDAIASGGRPDRTVPEAAVASGGPPDRSVPDASGPLGDAVDVLRQAARAGVDTVRWLPRLLGSPAERAGLAAALRRPPAGPPVAGEPRFFTSLIVETDAIAWEEKARARGGTANSLFIEIAANLVRAAVRTGSPTPIEVGLPMTLRESEDDGRANALVVLPLTVRGGPPRHSGLRRTRDATRELLSRTGGRGSTLVPEALWHLLPAGRAHRLLRPGAQQTDVVASNFGRTPDAVARFTGRPADGVAVRTMNVPGVVADRARIRASLCLVRTGDRMAVTVTGMPDHFGDGSSLARLVGEELSAWGLRADRWWGAGPTPHARDA
ncbi:hypothetical protein ACFWVP_04965 [Streptomyces sp. NPDC058637]|uniref:hypothetical protein n=1 Tax=Streptomyces sp. NPDC058637 TaxID=3346569 RepID=UPI00365AFE39